METQHQMRCHREIVGVLADSLNLGYEIVDKVDDPDSDPDRQPCSQDEKGVAENLSLVLVELALIVAALPHRNAPDHSEGFDIEKDIVHPVEFVFKGKTKNQPHFRDDEGKSERVQMGLFRYCQQ